MAQDLKKMVSKRLKELSKNIDGQDKSDAEKKLNISRPTIDKYLKGEVVKLDIAENLIVFFSDRVSKRIERIEAA